MPFDLDTKVDLKRAKVITLGTRELQVAPLTLRKIIELADRASKENLASLPAQAQIERLIDYVMLGLGRTYPSLTRDDLLESEITVEQLRAASDVIVEQAGGTKEKAGESTATSEPATSVGAVSSPSSALN